MIWPILAIIIAGLLWYVLVRPMSHFTRMGVKQSNPWPLFGDQLKTTFKMMSMADFVEWAYMAFSKTRYGGIYQLNLPTLVLRDPELIKQITIKDFDHFTDHRPFVNPECEPLWSGNLFALRGKKWREMRATLSASFTSSKMKHMFQVINEAAENFSKFFLNKNKDVLEVELKDTFTRYTNDVIATTAFGIKVDSLNEPDNIFYSMGKKLTNFGGTLMRLKFLVTLILPKLCKLLQISIFDKEVSKYFTDIIKETIAVRENGNIVRQDMINLLLEARKGLKHEDVGASETGFATVQETADTNNFKQMKDLTDEDITSQALIFFFAGFDSISTALCFGAYELAVNKDIQDRLRKEIQDTHRTNNGKLTYDSLLKMKYLDMVVSEVLRRWSPGVAVDRVCTKPYTIQPVLPDEKPVHLKVGDIIWLPIYGIHQDPEYWPNSKKFDPERFSDENKDNIKPYTYIPFGVGPRNCIGSRFALLECKAIFYHLLLNFEIVSTARTTIPLKLDRNTFNLTAENGFWFGLKSIRKL